MKKFLSLLLALSMICVMLTGCGGNKTPASSSGAGSGSGSGAGTGDGTIDFDEEPYEVSIQFVGMFEENNDIENVEAALNEITLEKINCTVDIVPLFIGNLPNDTSRRVAGDEKLDIVTVGLTQPVSSMVPLGLLLPLDDLLAERGQDALEATADVAEGQKIDGQTYGLTGYIYAAASGGFVYNKTLADEYGIKMHDGMTMDELSAVAEQLKPHGVALTTFGMSTEINYKFGHGGEYYGTGAAFGGILDPVNSTEIVNVYDTQEMRDYYKAVKAWNDNGYLMPGQLTDTVQPQEYFNQQKFFGTYTAYTADQIAAWVNSNFEVDVISLNDPVISTGGVAEFMLGIASNCKRPDKAMDLINLIYADPEEANLLQYGEEFNAEAAAIASVLAEQVPALNAGEVDDVDAAVDQLVADLETAGINDCIAANQAQLDAFLGQ